jgi:molybdenum cofactor guanylyltransferase
MVCYMTMRWPCCVVSPKRDDVEQFVQKTSSMTDDHVTAVVLAGGASRRMGVPKALLQIDGQTLLERVLLAVANAGIARRLVVGGDSGWADNDEFGAEWIADAFPGEGPLGGLATALDHVSTTWVFLLSCDLVSVDPNQLLVLLDLTRSVANVDAVVPQRHGQSQLLHALYRTSALTKSGVTEQFLSGERRLGSVLDGLRCYEVASNPVLDRSARDADTPEEFQDAMREH